MNEKGESQSGNGNKKITPEAFKEIFKVLKKKSRNFLSYIFGKVSIVHYQAAHERYWILWREIEEKLYSTFFELGLDFKEIDKEKIQSDEEVDSHIHALKNEILQKIKGSNNIAAKQGLSLLNHYKILSKDRNFLTRHEKDLCILWQDMTFIRIRLFREVNICGSELANYLDFCREEARNLKVQDLPEIKETLHEAAVELAGPTNHNSKAATNADNSNIRTVRALSTILIRLNSIRLQRIHNQLKIKNTYQSALFFLLPLALILIFSKDFVLKADGVEQAVYVPVWPDFFSADGSHFIQQIVKVVILPLYILGNWAAGLMATNPIFFVFVAGLMGGFLSTVMKLRTPEGFPGEDAFFKWYVLTKPFVGALAAAILYVIVHTGVVHLDFQNIEIINDIVVGPIGAKGFTFGFLMGFSERIIMPQLT